MQIVVLSHILFNLHVYVNDFELIVENLDAYRTEYYY